MKATVVIGANWGDEGKGLMVDYLANKKHADLVVRFNGGAQAGHTVVTPEGKRHVFSHFGSGTFLGIPTYLYKYFVLNPVLFREEHEQLKEFKPVVFVDSRSYVTTPFDMMFNQMLEESRGNERHGSCGVGIGATMERCEKDASNIINTYGSRSFDSLLKVRQYYLEMLAWLQYKKMIDHKLFIKWNKLFQDKSFITKYIEDCEYMQDNTHFINVFDYKYEHAIFEGAQGLALDQNMGNFPYVTRSNTGMRNVIKAQREFGFDIDEIVYVTRTYLTRHGADPNFKNAWYPDEMPSSIVDNTNVENSWQGPIQFSELNKHEALLLDERVETDLTSNGISTTDDRLKLAITHWDQLENDEYKLMCDYKSHGPARNDVEEVRNAST
jgi:adenylosuccinate synthase